MPNIHPQESAQAADRATLSRTDIEAIVRGEHRDPFAVLGPHDCHGSATAGLVIRVFRPGASAMTVVHRDDRPPHPMASIHPAGLFEAIVLGQAKPLPYRLRCPDASGGESEFEDPYREVHLGSWRRKNGAEFLDYREPGYELAVYVTTMGYTHVELLPITEHPFYGSWGYQTLGNFTPVVREQYRVGVPRGGFHCELLNSDAALCGGSNGANAGGVLAEALPMHGHDHSLLLKLPPLAALVLQPEWPR